MNLFKMQELEDKIIKKLKSMTEIFYINFQLKNI